MMLKKFLLSSAALLGLSAGAMAADLPARRAAPVFTPVPVFTWTGFYVGVNAGYAFSESDRQRVYNVPLGAFDGLGVGATGTGGTLVTGRRGERDGFTGGIQSGFNYQFGSIVLGFEQDIQYADLNRRDDGTFAYTVTARTPAGAPLGAVLPLSGPTANLVLDRRNTGIEYFSTTRGRIGVAFDRTLLYATGGIAFGVATDRGQTFGRFDEIRYGYTFGGGLEYAFTNSVTARVEGLYVNLDRRRESDNLCCVVNTLGQATAVPVTGGRNRDDNFAVVRAGLNYKFSSF